MSSHTKNKKNYSLISASGFSLVEVLIAIGILGIAMTAMTSMISYQSNAIKHLESKLAVLDLERHMITALSNSSICTYAVTNPAPQSFDSTVSTSSISLPHIQAAAAVGSPDIVAVGGTVSSGVTVQSIKIQNIQSVATDSFNAHLVVSFLNSSGPVLKPLDFLVSMNTNPASAANAKDVTSCNSSSSVLTGGHGIQVFTGVSDYFVVPEGVTSVNVTVQGAGGGGYTGGGGGGGGVATGTVNVTPHTQVYVQVGDGGAGGWWNIANTRDSTDGGTTSFGAAIVCAGGRSGDNASTRAGGTCTGGSSTTAGNPGIFHGAGGSGQGLGAGVGGANGVDGGLFGGGGGSSAGSMACTNNGFAICGGAGAPGRVIVEW